MNDQAAQLRRLMAGGRAARPVRAPDPLRLHRPARAPVTPPQTHLAQAIAVTSGKGGVGKTNIAVNLGVGLARLGRKVCLLDADLGLANADLLCGLTPRLTLEHVVRGRCRLAESMLLAPGGFRLLPGASGVARLADIHGLDRWALLDQLAALECVADDLIIDTAAGLSPNVLAFAAAAGRIVVVTTPEPTAMTDGYGLIKALAGRADAPVELIVNMVRSEAEADSVHERMNRVSRAFLNRPVEFAGSVPMDASVREAVRARVPFTLYAPGSPATTTLHRLARRLAGLDTPARRRGGSGFFARLKGWISKSDGPDQPAVMCRYPSDARAPGRSE